MHARFAMNITQQHAKLKPPGPIQPIDFTIDEATFTKIPELFSEYGDIVRVKSSIRDSDTYLVNRADWVKRVLVNNNRNYNKGYGFERVKLLLGNSIIVSDGDFWRAQRLMVQPAFHRSVMIALADMMHRVNVQLINDWEARAASGEPVDITTTTNRLALEVVMRGLFSSDFDWVNERSNLMSLLVDSTVRDLQLALKFRELRKVLLELVNIRRSRDEKAMDILTMLMEARNGDDQPMQDSHMIDEVVTVIVAGNETTAGTMNWTWYLLSQHPEAEQRVHAEVDALPDGDPTFADLEQLPFTKRVLNETLRLYPPVWLFSRKAIADDQLGDYHIPAGADILISPYYLHRNEDYWEDPERFDPDRFLDERLPAANKFAFIPFSAGPRRCIGDQFAMIEMQMHFANMTRRFKLRYIPDLPITLEPAINLRTLNNINMSVETR